MTHIKKHLSFDALINDFSNLINQIVDHRRTASNDYTVHDVMMSALACMYMQSPSLLAFQAQLEKKGNLNNLKSMFKVHRTPKPSAMKDFIDEIKPEMISPIFKKYITKLQRNNVLKEYKFFNDKYLVALDGTEYFRSKKINCDCCLQTHHKDGSVTYSHKALQPSIVSPNKKQIIPMMPEEISNQDGATKQDCEISASKRLIPKLRKAHPRLPIVWLADSLYATTPFINLIQSNSNDNFIFRIKKGDHKYLYDCIDSMEPEKYEHSLRDGKEILYYRWYNQIKLNASSTIDVNVLKIYSTKLDRHGNKSSTIIGVWVTDLEITQETVIDIARAARSRWMIENECFNTLKQHGYAIEHSYGHGQKNLSFNFYVLILLAFTLHQVQELTDKLFQQARKIYINKLELWQSLQFLFNMMIFDCWVQMMKYAIKIRAPDFEGIYPS